MKFNTILALVLAVCLFSPAFPVLAQVEAPPPAGQTVAETVEDADSGADEAPVAEILEWSDYTVKAYTLSVWGGGFSGATYLENKALGPRTVLTAGAGDIIAYDGGVLAESRDVRHYTAATKEVEAGNAFGARIGIYIADDFHLDLLGSYAAGNAVTSMLFTADPDAAPDVTERVVVDNDPGFKVYRGGVSLMYNATSADIFGVVPRLGFGLGGIINRYSELEDKTAFYLEGNFGLGYEIMDDVELGAQVDLTTFAFEVDELNYSNMVSYLTYSVGISWFIDRVPPQVRAAHIAEKN
jgi:hypothetical protein